MVERQQQARDSYANLKPFRELPRLKMVSERGGVFASVLGFNQSSQKVHYRGLVVVVVEAEEEEEEEEEEEHHTTPHRISS